MKTAAAVILYHPGENVISNIKSYCNHVGKLYIIDNTEQGVLVKEALLKLPGVEYVHDGCNEGLSKRLNTACNHAIRDGYEWLLTMDQDSSFPDNNFLNYLNCFNSFVKKESVALFGVSNDRAAVTVSPGCSFTEDSRIITSGSLMNIRLFKTIGPFDEKLYIDSVDDDYCIRAGLAGYKTIRFTNIFIVHQLGVEVYRASLKTFFLWKKKKSIHSPLRLYYMYRNMLYLNKKFEKENLPEIKQLKKDVMARVKRAIMYARKTIEILKYIKKAKVDFAKNRMGKIRFD
jgi:rhamnosyltransferase